MSDGLTACRAEEWHRDGRGLWAMRACRLWAIHLRHDFGAWQYNVSPPSAAPQPCAGCAALREALTAADRTIGELLQAVSARQSEATQAREATDTLDVFLSGKLARQTAECAALREALQTLAGHWETEAQHTHGNDGYANALDCCASDHGPPSRRLSLTG